MDTFIEGYKLIVFQLVAPVFFEGVGEEGAARQCLHGVIRDRPWDRLSYCHACFPEHDLQILRGARVRRAKENDPEASVVSYMRNRTLGCLTLLILKL